MDDIRWLSHHCASLAGKTLALTGATGGIGREICRGILALGGRLILAARDPGKAQNLKRELEAEYPGARIQVVLGDLTDRQDLDRMAEELNALEPDLLVHNAGAYLIPRGTCSLGWDTVFSINFAAPLYLTARLLPMLQQRRGKVVVMGSVAHRYSPTDEEDWDFASRQPIHLVYGNSKRYLMFGFRQLMARYPAVDFAIAHPGITVTNITAHYPRWLYAIIKYPMKVIFMSPRQAARSLLLALSTPVPRGSWMGPRYFTVWGAPAIRALRSCPEEEQQAICRRAEVILSRLQDGASREGFSPSIP